MTALYLQTSDIQQANDCLAELYPYLTGAPDVDASLLFEFIAAGEALIQQLPPKLDRNTNQARLAAQIRDTAYDIRRNFLSRHVNWLYDKLTQDRTASLRLEELVRRGAELFPGLVPSTSVMREESERLQAEKEGYEIDQGLFFHALLAEPRIGAHVLAAMQRPTIRALEILPKFCASGRAELQAVTIERRGTAAYLTITNNHCLNSEDLVHVIDMETAVDLALLDPAVHVCVVRGGVMTHARYKGKRILAQASILRRCTPGKSR